MARAQGEIYASVLHDINSPLTVISGFVEMINRSHAKTPRVEGQQLESLRDDLSNKLNGQVGRCFEISRRYLSFLRKITPDPSHVGVNQIMSDLKELLIRHPSTRGHQLAIQRCPRTSIAEINGTDLLQILLNLTINALQASDQPHRVEVQPQCLAAPLDLAQLTDSGEQRFVNRESFQNRAPLLAISVQDNGPGISAENVEKMFQSRFTTKSADKGTGLGLSIVKRLVKEAHGAIHLRTKIGSGSTFTICVQARVGTAGN